MAGSKGTGANLTVADSLGCPVEPFPAPSCGTLAATPKGLTGEKISMPEFAQALGSMFRRVIVDRTGLTGVFDIVLDLSPSAPAPGDNSRSINAQAPDDNVGVASAVIVALRSQLGLKFESTKFPAEMVVVDRV
jgi:uncharacterized protein (TIGR03435 family)